MKKILFIVFAISIQLSAFADKKTPAQKAKEKTDEMVKELTLTADQQKKIYDINLKAYTAIDAYEDKKPSKKLKKKQKEGKLQLHYFL